MPTQTRRNLGQTSLRKRSRTSDPMRDYDRLPAPLRHWLAQAVLPWSPKSCLKLWTAARARGASEPEALAHLARAEQRMLRKDQVGLAS